MLHGDLEQDERMRVIDGFRKLRQSLERGFFSMSDPLVMVVLGGVKPWFNQFKLVLVEY